MAFKSNISQDIEVDNYFFIIIFVYFFFYFFCFVVAIFDLVHIVQAIFLLPDLLTASGNLFSNMSNAHETAICSFIDIIHISEKISRCC